MADRRDHRGGGGMHRAHQGLIGEGQQILQRPAAPGQDNDVDAGIGIQIGQGRDDLPDGVRTLHQGVAYDESHGRPAQPGIADDVLLRVGVRPGDEPHALRQQRQGLAQLRTKQSFGLQLTASFLQLGEQLALTSGANLGDDERQPTTLAPHRGVDECEHRHTGLHRARCVEHMAWAGGGGRDFLGDVVQGEELLIARAAFEFDDLRLDPDARASFHPVAHRVDDPRQGDCRVWTGRGGGGIHVCQ